MEDMCTYILLFMHYRCLCLLYIMCHIGACGRCLSMLYHIYIMFVYVIYYIVWGLVEDMFVYVILYIIFVDVCYTL